MDENKFWQTITPDSLLIWDQTFPPPSNSCLMPKELAIAKIARQIWAKMQFESIKSAFTFACAPSLTSSVIFSDLLPIFNWKHQTREEHLWQLKLFEIWEFLLWEFCCKNTQRKRFDIFTFVWNGQMKCWKREVTDKSLRAVLQMDPLTNQQDRG